MFNDIFCVHVHLCVSKRLTVWFTLTLTLTLRPHCYQILLRSWNSPHQHLTHTRVHTHIHSLSLCLCNTQFGEVLVKNVLVSEFGQLSKRDQDHKNTSHFDVKSHGSKITKKTFLHECCFYLLYMCYTALLHDCLCDFQ